MWSARALDLQNPREFSLSLTSKSPVRGKKMAAGTSCWAASYKLGVRKRLHCQLQAGVCLCARPTPLCCATCSARQHLTADCPYPRWHPPMSPEQRLERAGQLCGNHDRSLARAPRTCRLCRQILSLYGCSNGNTDTYCFAVICGVCVDGAFCVHGSQGMLTGMRLFPLPVPRNFEYRKPPSRVLIYYC